MTIKINSGHYRGMSLKLPQGLTTRPTISRVREAVLNSLGASLAHAAVLDLFAGSGAWGIEALSRGAKSAAFVERDQEAIKCLRAYLNETARRAASQGLPAPITQLHTSDLRICLESVVASGPYTIVWADPPYDEAETWAEELVATAAALLEAGGLFLLESRADSGPKILGCIESSRVLELIKQRRYGDTTITTASRVVSERGSHERAEP